METVRAVVIGYGGMGRRYVEMLHKGEVKGMSLAGVCCRNAQGQAGIRKAYPYAAVYGNVDEVFACKDGFDAAVIVTPHETHVEMGLMAARAGKHILMDKPAGVCAGEVKRLLEAVKESSVSFGMIFNTRMKGAYERGKTFLEEGRLGKVTRAVWICNTWYRTPAYHHSAPWRSTWKGEHGGLLINQCQHYLDIWQWYFGMPDEVYASIDMGKYSDITVDDSFDLQFLYKSGLRGTFISATGEHPGTNRLEIWGTRGRLTIEDGNRIFFDENMIPTDEFAKVNKEIYGKPDHSFQELSAENREGREYRMIFQKFADHLLYGREMAADGEEGLRSVMMANGAYLSSWLDRRISFPVDDRMYEQMLKTKEEEEKALTL